MEELNYVAIGHRIRAVRHKQGLSQEALCNLIDISPSHMSHIESGKTKPSLIAVIAIANALNTTTDSLLYDNVQVSVSTYDKEFKDLIEDCTEEERRILLENALQLKEILRKNSKSAKNRAQECNLHSWNVKNAGKP